MLRRCVIRMECQRVCQGGFRGCVRGVSEGVGGWWHLDGAIAESKQNRVAGSYPLLEKRHLGLRTGARASAATTRSSCLLGGGGGDGLGGRG